MAYAATNNHTAALGRPRSLSDPEKQKTLCSLISVGLGITAAAKHVGCSAWTVRREAQRDSDFATRLREAETSAKLAPLAALRKKAQTHWRAAAWWLERMHPEQFARKQPGTIAPLEILDLLDEVVSIVNEECDNPEQVDLMCERIEALQADQFGDRPGAMARTPEPKSEMDRFFEKVERETTEQISQNPTADKPTGRAPINNHAANKSTTSQLTWQQAARRLDQVKQPERSTKQKRKRGPAKLAPEEDQRTGNSTQSRLADALMNLCLAKVEERETPQRAENPRKQGARSSDQPPE